MRMREAERQKAVREYHLNRNEVEMRRERKGRARAQRNNAHAAADEAVEEDAPESECTHNRHYTEQQRRDAVEAMMHGVGPKRLEKEMGICYSTLCKWRRDAGYESKRLAAMRRNKEEREQQVNLVAQEIRQDLPPRPPTGRADRLTRFCYLMDTVNYNRRKQGLPMIQYGEMQQHLERYEPWLPEGWKKWLK